MSRNGKGMFKDSHYKKWLILFLAFLAWLVVGSMAIVYYFDPLCCTGTIRKHNRIIPVIDARLQKTNMLLRSNNNYDALLIGSSRPEQFRQEDFLPLHVFNYSAPSMYPDEFEEYIDLFLQNNKKKTKIIFLGLDFYGTNLKMYKHVRPPSFYIKSCSSPLTWRNLLSIDSLKYALRMARGKNDRFNYDRITIDKLTGKISRKESERVFRGDLAGFAETFYGDYVYNPDYRRLLREVKERHSQVRFVVFTTPETAQLFKVLVSKGRMGDYERWLQDIIDVFGGVYNFMLPTSFTMNRDNFFDAQHLYPEKATPIVRRIMGESEQRGAEIGYLLTQKTIKVHLDKVHKLIMDL